MKKITTKKIMKYCVYRKFIAGNLVEFQKPGGDNEFDTHDEAVAAIIENTSPRRGSDPLWYEDFPYVIFEEISIGYV